MEEYWNNDDPSVEQPEEELLTEEYPSEEYPAEELFDEGEPELAEEPPKPKKKKKKMTFKRRVRRALRRFFKLPLMTRIIAGVLVLVVLVVIIVLLVVLPKSCGNKTTPAAVDAPTATPDDLPVAVDTPDPGEEQPTPNYTQAPTDTPTPTLTQTVKPNERDAIVPYVRTRLVELGYMEMPTTNDELYDTATINAVRRFQYRNFPENNKEWDGYIGTKTFEKMFADDVKAFFIKSGDTDAKLYDGSLVTKMQNQLVALGYLTAANGNCDSKTVDAIRAFQKANSLDADGVAGQTTLKLLESLANAASTTAPVEDTPVITDPTEAPND